MYEVRESKQGQDVYKRQIGGTVRKEIATYIFSETFDNRTVFIFVSVENLSLIHILLFFTAINQAEGIIAFWGDSFNIWLT